MRGRAQLPATSQWITAHPFIKSVGGGGGKQQYEEMYGATPVFTTEFLQSKKGTILLLIVFFSSRGENIQDIRSWWCQSAFILQFESILYTTHSFEVAQKYMRRRVNSIHVSLHISNFTFASLCDGCLRTGCIVFVLGRTCSRPHSCRLAARGFRLPVLWLWVIDGNANIVNNKRNSLEGSGPRTWWHSNLLKND